jgi:hypothetical protein
MAYLDYGCYDSVNFSDLIGKTLKDVVSSSNEINFYTECGLHYRMFHEQDCCEHVYIDNIEGSLEYLIGRPIYSASEDSDRGPCEEWGDSVTWTFYRLRTDREFVHITWRGSSNGYYSEGVSFYRMKTTPMNEED